MEAGVYALRLNSGKTYPKFLLHQLTQSIQYLSISMSCRSQRWDSSSESCLWFVPLSQQRQHICTSLAFIFISIWHNYIILSLYTVSILTLDLLMLSFNGFLLIWLIVHTTSLYLIIVLLLLLYTQVFLRDQFLALHFSPCILSLCLPILSHTII